VFSVVIIASFVTTEYTTRTWGWLLGRTGYCIKQHCLLHPSCFICKFKSCWPITKGQIQRLNLSDITSKIPRPCQFCYLLTYLLTPWSAVLLEKPSCSQIIKEFPAFYGMLMFIIAPTKARQLSLSCASSIRPIPPHPTSWRSILILSSHLIVGLQSVLFPSGLPTKSLYTPLLSPTTYMSRPTQFRYFYLKKH
jgi:hypothetical protein